MYFHLANEVSTLIWGVGAEAIDLEVLNSPRMSLHLLLWPVTLRRLGRMTEDHSNFEMRTIEQPLSRKLLQ